MELGQITPLDQFSYNENYSRGYVYLSELSEDRLLGSQINPTKGWVTAWSDGISICMHGKGIIHIFLMLLIKENTIWSIYKGLFGKVYNIDSPESGWHFWADQGQNINLDRLPGSHLHRPGLDALWGSQAWAKSAIWRIPISEGNPVQNWPWNRSPTIQDPHRNSSHCQVTSAMKVLCRLAFLTKTFLFTKILGKLPWISFPSHLYGSGCYLRRGFFLACRSRIKPLKVPSLWEFPLRLSG